MATIREVIQDQLATYSLDVSAVRLDTVLADNDLNGSVTYDKSQTLPVKRVILAVASGLLLMPDVTEGGYSVKWDRNAVQAYCNQLRSDLGIVDASQPVVSDKSYLW